MKYIFNKAILLNDTYSVFEYTKAGNKTTDFDSYSNWNASYILGKDVLDALYARCEKLDITAKMTDEDCRNLQENLNQNGMLNRQFELEKEAIKTLLAYDNVYLFAFLDEYNMICDLNNYKDVRHYGENINSQILLRMCHKEHLLIENYEEYCDNVYKFYTTYDYDALF